MAETFLEVYFTGDGVSLGAIRSKEIADLIAAVENMIASKIVCDHPEIDKESIVIGIVAIESGSLKLKYRDSLPKYAQQGAFAQRAANDIASSINLKKTDTLPEETIKSLKLVASFTKKYKGQAEFYELNGQKKLLTQINSETEILEPPLIKGETTIYGEITRVGGANHQKPSIQFRSIDGSLIHCSTSKLIAKEAGLKLYQQVGLSGVAEWNSRTLGVESFYVNKISDYEHSLLSEAFSELSDKFSAAFDSIGNVNDFLEEVRYGGEKL